MATHRSLAAAMAKLALAGALVLLCCCNRPACAQVQGEGDIIPYLLFASSRCIYRMELNGTRVAGLLCDSRPGIMALDYHYRKGYVYWTNVMDHTIKRARLDGSNVTNIVENVLYSAGLAVDWINDKVYWTDRDSAKIEVYDMTTGEQSTVIVRNPDSRIYGLAIYPFQGSGILSWGERGVQRQAIHSALVGTTERESLRRTSCPWPLTIDPVTQTVVWSDHCTFDIQSVFLNGTNHRTVLPGRTHRVHFSYGVTLFQESLFWTQANFVYTVNRRGNVSVTEIFDIGDPLLQIRERQLNGISVVHPFKQPTANQLAGLAQCYTQGCVNGICQPSGQCSCYPGWAGRSCSINSEIDECAVSNGNCQQQCIDLVGSSECACDMGFNLDSNQRNCTDVDECDVSNGGCEHQCTNTVGSYECSCNEGFSLDSNGSNCADVNECTILNGGCEQQCTNLLGSYECSCSEGFVLGDNERNCNVVDECAVSNGGCTQLCINVVGGRVCLCFEGFQASGATCVDTRTPPGPEISPSSVALPNEGPTSTSRHAVGTNTPGIDPGSVTVSPQVHPTPIVPSEDILDTKTVVGTEPSPIPPVMVGTEPSPISPVVVGTEPSPISPVVVGTEPSPIPPVLVGTEPSPIPPVVVETEPPPIPPVVDSTSKNNGRNTLIMIIVTVTVGAAVLIGAAVGYAAVLYCKYRRRRTGSWTPKHFERNSNPQRTSFRRISESESTSNSGNQSSTENSPTHSLSALEQQANSTVDSLSFQWNAD